MPRPVLEKVLAEEPRAPLPASFTPARRAAGPVALLQHPLRETKAVVLCGGRGSSLGALTADAPKQMVEQRDARTLPCFARFLFPSIGFDGWLSHCSESAAPHFRELALGNLAERDFWDVYYDYAPADVEKLLADSAEKMCKTGCKCDRKEHVVNARLRSLGMPVGQAT